MNQPNSGMRPSTDPVLYFGAALQVFRGILFAAVFYPFRDKLSGNKQSWLLMAWMLVGLGILGTFGGPAGSLEGFIYTTTPFLMQVRSYVEIGTQAVLLSLLLCYWVNHPKRWLSWLLGGAYALCTGLPMLGLAAQHSPEHHETQVVFPSASPAASDQTIERDGRRAGPLGPHQHEACDQN